MVAKTEADARKLTYFWHPHLLMLKCLGETPPPSSGQSLKPLPWTDISSMPSTNLPRTINHPAHPTHNLDLCFPNSDSNFFCDCCYHKIDGYLYACIKDDFHLHVVCASLPPIITNHPSHPDHPLSLHHTPPYSSGAFNCDACLLPGDHNCYHCNQCNFDVHVICPNQNHTPLVVKTEADAKKLTYFWHPHLLMLKCLDETPPPCSGHSLKPLPWTDICSMPPANLPRTINHPAHPAHNLNLCFPKLDIFTCDSCHHKIDGYLYGCFKDDFHLHVVCASLPPIITNHPSHPDHPLSLHHKSPYSSGTFVCDVCGLPGNHSCYHCNHCNFDVHVICPNQNHTPLLPQEPPPTNAADGGSGFMSGIFKVDPHAVHHVNHVLHVLMHVTMHIAQHLR